MRTAAVLCALILVGCGERKSPELTEALSYFPLAEGASWRYNVTLEADGKTIQTSQQIRMIGQQQHEGQKVHIRRSQRDANIGVEYWIGADAQGVQRIAQRTDMQDTADFDVPPRTVLKFPLQPGASWTVPTVAFAVLRSADFSRKVKERAGTTMKYTVEAIDQKVTVPAGSFDKCARIKGRAEVTLDMGRVVTRADDTQYTDALERIRKVPLVQTEWYCPGVGLTRLERVEAITLNFSSAEKVRMELTGYEVR